MKLSVKQHIFKISEYIGICHNTLLSLVNVLSGEGKYAELSRNTCGMKIIERRRRRCKTSQNECKRYSKMCFIYFSTNNKIYEFIKEIKAFVCNSELVTENGT